jgi:predicted nucleic acid-binding protein
MILGDTSVWIEHLRNENDRLKILLFEEQVVCHPFVIGELACGTLPRADSESADGVARG